MAITVRSVFYESNKYYPQVFIDECLYKLAAMRAKNLLNNT